MPHSNSLTWQRDNDRKMARLQRQLNNSHRDQRAAKRLVTRLDTAQNNSANTNQAELDDARMEVMITEGITADLQRDYNNLLPHQPTARRVPPRAEDQYEQARRKLRQNAEPLAEEMSDDEDEFVVPQIHRAARNMWPGLN